MKFYRGVVLIFIFSLVSCFTYSREKDLLASKVTSSQKKDRKQLIIANSEAGKMASLQGKDSLASNASPREKALARRAEALQKKGSLAEDSKRGGKRQIKPKLDKKEKSSTQNKGGRLLTKANSEYDNFAYVKANELYKELIEKGHVSGEVYARLGDTYYFNSNYVEALKNYTSLINLKEPFKPEYYYRYAQCLKTAGNYEESSKMMELYYNAIRARDKAEEIKAMASPLEEIKKQSGRYTIVKQPTNSSSVFGIVFNGDKEIIYTSTGPQNSSPDKNYNWNNKPFLKLFSATVDANGNLTNNAPLEGDIDMELLHQSTATITKDGNTMYFTQNSFSGTDLQRDKVTGINKLKIYRADKVDNKWENVQELPFPINSDAFSSAHPALSPDGKRFYFVTDRKNAPGNTDIYVVGMKGDGKFENNLRSLGDKVNTLGRETFPYVDDYGILYFASDGHGGLGGLDVFAALEDKKGEYHVFNLGEPINSSSDDYGYIINHDTKKGFFTSNREKAEEDHIYSFVETTPPIYPFDINPVVKGVLKDSLTSVPIIGASITVYNDKKEEVASITTNEKGEYSIPLTPLKDYTFSFKKRGFTKETVEVKGLKLQEEKAISIVLFNDLVVVVDDIVVTLQEGDDLTKILKLKPIYFDNGFATIRKSSRNELDKVANLLRHYPNISIDVRSHTDSKGNRKKNLELSQRRAKATIDYIIKNGNILPDRIKGRGYGEVELLNGCKKGVKCTEAQHQLNRRSEFLIRIEDKEENND